MKTSMRVENPEKVSVTLKVTMTIEEWQQLRSQLDIASPSWKLAAAIRDLVVHVEQQFISHQEAAE